MNFTRKVLRNQMRKKYGNKGVQAAWANYQIKKYSFKGHEKIKAESKVLKGIKRLFRTLKNKLARKRRGRSITNT